MTDNRTIELRELLDERGVEYDETTEYVTTAYLDDKVVRYYGYDGDFSVEVIFPRPYLNNTAWLTPEQAIAATLGGGTCRIIASSTDGLCSDNPRQLFKLSCGHSLMLYGLDAPVACAVCGKAVKR